MNNKYLTLTTFVISAITATAAGTAPVVRMVYEPRQVSSCSSKSEHAWATCEWCGGRISYERTSTWDPYDRVWIETTANVPSLCRKCQSKQKGAEKLAREEANLDRKIAEKEAKERIAAKRQLLRNWPNSR